MSQPSPVADPEVGRVPVVLAWPDHLDALEEWLRRTRDALQGGALESLPGPLVSVGDGPLPEGLRLRAAVALQELQRLQATGLERRLGLARGQAYQRF
ncbi:MAG: hypothetical protein JWM64_2026 [Frankiales bacterium]|nr:hypothetical protein [Frankiales bacterium]